MSKNPVQSRVITRFRGQSGCSVELMEGPGPLCVVKSAFAVDVSSRLKGQCAKLQQLQMLKSVRVPVIYEISESNSSFFYKMEYCAMTRTLVEAAEEMSLYELRDVVDFLIRLLAELGNITAPKSIEFGAANWNKLESIKMDATLNCYPGVRNCLDQLLVRHNDYFSPILTMKSSFCHGDLTLDNILCDLKNQRWLIDPIHCFFEHPWCDLAKLYQDIQGEWFQIRNRINQRKASSNLWRLGASLKDWIREAYPDYSNYHYYFLGLNFARILPYVGSEYPQLQGIVADKAETFLKKFIQGEKL